MHIMSYTYLISCITPQRRRGGSDQDGDVLAQDSLGDPDHLRGEHPRRQLPPPGLRELQVGWQAGRHAAASLPGSAQPPSGGCPSFLLLFGPIRTAFDRGDTNHITTYEFPHSIPEEFGFSFFFVCFLFIVVYQSGAIVVRNRFL